MKKEILCLLVSGTVALCAMGMVAPVAAGEVPTETPPPVAAPAPSERTLSTYEAFVAFASSLARTAKVVAQPTAQTEAVAATGAVSTMPTAPRVAPVARSYPRSFGTYDDLVEYANSLAATQQASNDRLAALMAREDETRAALASVFNPLVRGGLLRSRTDLIDDANLQSLQTQLANDARTAAELEEDGAVLAPAANWRMPLRGEDTQDFGPTPYWFEPAMTYQDVYYPHFHTGTDIAAAWGTPILAPARGVVVFAGPMSDGAEVVVIAHDGGFVSMYAHLENRVFPVPVKAGDTVQAGDQIGNVGLTGITTGAHLHWSVWRNGKLIDPLSLIGG
jgi:murein DD-endopeptidase MepM/ murein hydrolase activator NlpD